MKLLIVSPYFAPYSLVGAQRMNSFVRYMAEKGHDITVVAFSVEHLRTVAPAALNADIPELVKVERVDVKTNIKSVSGRNSYYESAFLKALDSVLKEESYDLCLVSVGPFFTLNAVRTVMKRYDIPYFIDYRDLISMGQCKGLVRRIKSVRASVNNYVNNKRAIRDCKGVITISEECKNILRRKYAGHSDCFHVVYNGFDEKQLLNMPSVTWKPEVGFSVGYFGKFMYYQKDLGIAILRALSELREMGVEARLYHIGPEIAGIEKILHDREIDQNCYVNLGSKPYAEGVAYLHKMNCCAIEWNSSFGLGTKVFDYIYANKPIIGCMNSDTELGRFLKQFRNAIVTTSVDDIKNFVLRIINEKEKSLDNDTDPMLYSREKQNEKYENILKEALP